MKRRITKVVLHHSAVKQDDLEKLTRSIQKTHKYNLWQPVDQYWSHIAYHFLIGVDWTVRTTRDLDSIGWHASNYKVNKESIGICLSWHFDDSYPTKEQYRALYNLIVKLQRKYRFSIHEHNEYANKTCPWKHFDISMIFPENNTDLKTSLQGKLVKIANKMYEYLQTKSDCTRYASGAVLSTAAGKKLSESDRDGLKDYSSKRGMIIWKWSNYIEQAEITLDRWNDNDDDKVEGLLIPIVSQDCKDCLAAWYRGGISRRTSPELVRDWIDWAFYGRAKKRFTWSHMTTIYFDFEKWKIAEVNSKYWVFQRNKTTYYTSMKELIKRGIVKPNVIFYVKYE